MTYKSMKGSTFDVSAGQSGINLYAFSCNWSGNYVKSSQKLVNTWLLKIIIYVFLINVLVKIPRKIIHVLFLLWIKTPSY